MDNFRKRIERLEKQKRVRKIATVITPPNQNQNNADISALTTRVDIIESIGVTKVGTPVDNQIGVWTGDGTIEGDAKLTFDGNTLSVERTDASTNTVLTVLDLYRSTSGTASNGIGVRISFRVEGDDGDPYDTAYIDSVFDAQLSSELQFFVLDAAGLPEPTKMMSLGNGALNLYDPNGDFGSLNLFYSGSSVDAVTIRSSITGGIFYVSKGNAHSHVFTEAVKTSGTHLTMRIQQSAHTGGSNEGIRFECAALTGQTASLEITDFEIDSNRSIGRATGAVTTQRSAIFNAPTFTFVGASTITDASTVYIASAPVASTNATITNNSALWIASGAIRLGALAQDDALTQVVVRDSSTGHLKYRDSDTISSNVLISDIDISSAQILAGFDTPIILVADPGAGKMINVIGLSQKFIYNSIAYATNTSSLVVYNNNKTPGGAIGIMDLSVTATEWRVSPSQLGSITTSPESQALVWAVETGNPTAGNSTLKIRVTYRIVDFS